MNAAYDVKLKPSEKAVLNNLAGRSNADSGLCNPSIARISNDTGFARSTIFLALKVLESLGLISRKTVGLRCNHYIVHLDVILRLSVKEVGPVHSLDGSDPANGLLKSGRWTQTKKNKIESIAREGSSRPVHVEGMEAKRQSNGVAVVAATMTTAELLRTARGYLKIGQQELANEYLNQLEMRTEANDYTESPKVVSLQSAIRSSQKGQ